MYKETYRGWTILQRRMEKGVLAGPGRYRYYIYPPYATEPISWEVNLNEARATMQQFQELRDASN